MSTLIPYYAHVDVYSHGFRVHKFDERVRKLCYEFCLRYVEHEFSKGGGRGSYQAPAIKKVYAAATRQRDQYFFHRGHLEEFLAHLRMNRVGAEYLNITHVPMYEPVKVDFNWCDADRSPHDYQRRIIDFFLKPDPRTKICTVQPGKGKTFTTIRTAYEQGERVVGIMAPKYLKIWRPDAAKTMGLKPGELVTVNGTKELRLLIQMAKEGVLDAKFILISNATYRMFLRDFFDSQFDDTYGVKPWEFFELLGAGIRVIDEVHEFYHLNWLIDCLTHVPKSISLSATMESDKMFRNQLYLTMFPQNTRAPIPEYDRYIDVYSIAYRIRENRRIRYLVMQKYHQATYEQSIRKYPKVYKAFIDMVVELVDAQHFKHRDYRPGMKTALFFGYTDTAVDVVKALQDKYPDKVVRRFLGTYNDPESHLADGDIVVTTTQSCGTGKDIPDLATGFSYIALSDLQANEQLVGRLRKLKQWPEITPRFYFMYNNENPKHQGYQVDRKHKLNGKMRSFNELISSFIL